MHGQDLTPGLQTGLGWYYLVVCLCNVAFAYFRQRLAKDPKAYVWYVVAGVFLVLAGLNFLHAGIELPEWFKDWANFGAERGLQAMGASSLAPIAKYVAGLYLLALIPLALFDYWRPVAFRWLSPAERLAAWFVIISVLALVMAGTNAITFFVASCAGFAAILCWRKPLTEPNVAWGILIFTLLMGGLSMTDYDFRQVVVKPDNLPIVGMVIIVGFFTWLAFRRAVINDERMAKGEPPLEKLEDEKVLVWPDLVYTELICMILVTAFLIVWSVALVAPLEQPASSTKTPFSSKAPWYFLGLQEMLVYYDPWIAGVLLPTLIIIGLMAIPYIDFNQKGNGYYTYDQRPFAIVNFLFGFIVLWVVLIFLGTFLRGPNWNFFGPYETWDTHKVVAANNVNLSDYVWIRTGLWIPEHPSGTVSLRVIFFRELPGILLVGAYFLLVPPLLARTVFRDMFIKMGFARYMTMVTLMLFMASLPIKMVLRWSLNLKYVVAIPEYFFNI